MARYKRPDRAVRLFATALLVILAIAALNSFRGQEHNTLRERRQLAISDSDDTPCELVHQAADQCAFVRKYCRDEDSGLISYLNIYYCSLARVKPLAFIIIAIWAALLFTTIGVAASDFFCINLSTIAGVLGMSESMAGVTFLAFGNGSPDVFSTFAAMKTHSGSLAVGELIGAASFITAVVAASMALIRPFKVAKKSFVRDVGFFIVAVAFSTYFLANGKLGLLESIVMVTFYLFYVVVVVVWHWYLSRRRRQREADAAARGHYSIPGEDEIETEEQYHDDPDDGETARRPSRSRVVTVDDMIDLERANGDDDPNPLDDLDQQAERNRLMGDFSASMRVTRPPGRKRSSTMTPIRPSLVGALEFQAVLSTLQKSRNIHDPPINLRRYSDGLGYTDVPQKGPNSTVSDPELHAELEQAVPHSALPDLPGQRPISQTDDRQFPFLVQESPGDQTPEWPSRASSPAIALSTPPPEDGVETTLPNRSRGSTMTDLLAPPGQLHSGPHRLPSPSPRFTSSPPSMSPQLRPQLKISPPGSVYDDSGRQYVFGSYSSRAADSSLSAHPSPRRLDSTDTMHSGLYLLNSNKTVPLKPNWWPYDVLPPPDAVLNALLPTLTKFQSKGFFEKVLGICTAPSFFLLSITLPVVEPPVEEVVDVTKERTASITKHAHHSRLSGHDSLATEAVSIEERHRHHDHMLDQSGSLTTIDEDLAEETNPVAGDSLAANPDSSSNKDWNRWLVLIQCFTAPWFIITVIWANLDEVSWSGLVKSILWSIPGSFICATILCLTTSSTRPPRFQFLLCFAGFAVSIAWISSIANEVVGVLKAIGVMFNMSDAILGLTIFAVGNSLGDLVADVTVARLGYPVMALSACFGGPMLNILLGIGLSGCYMVVRGEEKYHKKHPHKTPRFKPFEIEVSWTLLISAVGLLITLVSLLILVPLNKWRMDRRIGGLLVGIWVVSTIVNIVVEVTGVSDNWTMR